MNDIRKAIEQLVGYCNDKWVEAATASRGETLDYQAGRKAAYNDVYHFAQSLLVRDSAERERA